MRRHKRNHSIQRKRSTPKKNTYTPSYDAEPKESNELTSGSTDAENLLDAEEEQRRRAVDAEDRMKRIDGRIHTMWTVTIMFIVFISIFVFGPLLVNTASSAVVPRTH